MQNNNARENHARDYRKDEMELSDKLKKFVEENNKIHINRLNPHYKLNLDTEKKVRIIPLGGLGEIGGNITVFETDNDAIIVDVGMSFPDETMPGVNILIPDFSYIRSIQDKIRAVIITHAHEDHIGAMPFLFKEMQFPVYGTSLALQMIASKFKEHKLQKFYTLLNPIKKRELVKVGEFEIEWMHVTHSIIDCSSLAITTEAGTIIHTGDFKIDHTPVDNFPTDLHRYAHYGEKGIMLLMSDSTNSYNVLPTKSELVVGKTFDKIFAEAKGRIIMSTFSSNTHRIYQAIQRAITYKRKLCVIGRSMEKNLDIAMDLGYVRVPQSMIIKADELEKYADNELLVVTTGSQGEPMSALFRMATDEHRQIKLKPTDDVVISAKAIPGNEASVSSVINHILKAGARVIYQDYTDIHVSGHASAEEQKLMLRLCKPKFFMPIHGEFNHITQHKKTGLACGILEKNTYLMSDGEIIEVCPKYIKKVGTVRSGKNFINNNTNSLIDNNIVHDRYSIAQEGIVIVSMAIDKNRLKLVSKVKVNSRGIINTTDFRGVSGDIEFAVKNVINSKAENKSSKPLEQDIRQATKRIIVKKYKKYPIIDVSLFYV